MTAPDEKRRAWPCWIAPTALLVVVFAINFAAMPATWWAGDPSAWREETRSLLRDGALHVNTQYAEQIGAPGSISCSTPNAAGGTRNTA